MKEGKVTDTRRAEVVALWRRASAKLSQEEFVSSLQRDQGIDISTRTLRAWCARFGGAANAGHVERARIAVADVLRRVTEAEERLRAVLTDLDAQREVTGAVGTALDGCSAEAGGPRGKIVRVGVSCFVVRQRSRGCARQLLVGRRLGSHGAGLISVPGGHLEFGERFSTAAKRELEEECGLRIIARPDRLLSTRDVIEFLPEKQFVDVAVSFLWKEDEPLLMEPEKCAGWEWRDLASLLREENLFPGVRERVAELL